MLDLDVIDLIKSSVPLLEKHGKEITDTFYRELFTHHPYMKNIFNMTNQKKGDQSQALAEAVVAYAKNIENLEPLLPAVNRIANKHVSLGIQAKHYEVVGTTLLEAIQKVLQLKHDDAVLRAWEKAYNALANIFISVEKSLYEKNSQKNGGWEGYRDFYIDQIIEEAKDVKSFYFKPLDLGEIPTFKSGQYLGVKVRPNDSAFYQIRQYSLSKNGELRITVKAEPEGLVSNYLHKANIGDSVLLQAPTGVFNFKNKRENHIFVAGGVGITPLMGMLDDALAEKRRKGINQDNVLFVQCAKDEKHQLFKDELQDMKKETSFTHKVCFEHSTHGNHKGWLNVDVLQTWLANNNFNGNNTEVYFCGPKPFMKSLKTFFTELGFDEDAIHYEVFGPTTGL